MQFIIYIGIVLLLLVIGNVVGGFNPGGSIILLIVAVLWGLYLYGKKQKIEHIIHEEIDPIREIREHIESLVLPHIKTLARKKRQFTYINDYAQPDYKRWESEKAYFITSIIMPHMSEYDNDDIKYINISDLIDVIIANANKYIEPDLPTEYIGANMTPLEYEKFCCEIFKKSGWSVSLTKNTGDQGVDIIAEKNDIKVVSQCKMYSSNVGNKAVMEVYSAKGFENADYAIVISNAGYTRSAKQLADSLGVLLIHHEQIPDVHNLIKCPL